MQFNLTNNQGYQFFFQQGEGENFSIQISDQNGRTLGKVDKVIYNTTSQTVQNVLQEIKSRTEQGDSLRTTHEIQYYKHDGDAQVVIGGYKHIVPGTASAALMILGVKGLNSGSGFRYCWYTPESDITITGFLQKSTVGAVTGGFAAGIPPLDTTFVASSVRTNLAAGAIANVAGNVADPSIENKVTPIDPTQLIKSAVVGSVTERLYSPASQSASFGAAGAVSSATAQVSENVI